MIRALAWIGPDKADDAVRILGKRLPPVAVEELAVANTGLPPWLSQILERLVDSLRRKHGGTEAISTITPGSIPKNVRRGLSVEGVYDLAVIGGGINGCGIARDAAGRGFSVYLCEKNDLASGHVLRFDQADSWRFCGISNMGQFRLVREALIEREVLWTLAPHAIKPLRFVLPHHRGLRPAWLLRLGLLLYDHIGGRERLPATRTFDLSRDAAGPTAEAGGI